MNKLGTLVLLMALAIVSTGAMAEPVSAASTNVNSSMNSSQIQSIIDSAGIGDTINFLTGTYNNISLSINKALNLVGNGATLISNGINAVISATNTNGVNITGFNINGNGSAYGINFTNVNNSAIVANNVSNTSKFGINVADTGNLTSYNNVSIDGNVLTNTTGGISASGAGINVTRNYIDMYNSNGNGIGGSWYSVLIQNNVILNGGAGLSTTSYQNLTVNNNTIVNMTRNYGDAISLVNMAPEVNTSTTITNNILDTNLYGIFLGGYFTGNVSGNSINNSSIGGMNITGKHSPTSGNLDANITGNIINNSNIGIAMENPNVKYLNMDYNYMNTTGSNLAYNSYYKENGTVIIGNHNYFSNHPTHVINASLLNNTQIQAIIDNAGAGDTIEFLTGVYSNISLSITKALNLIGNGAVLTGNGANPVINIAGSAASGTNVTNLFINGNGSIYGVNISNTQGINIGNNTIQNCTGSINVNGSGNLNIHDNNLLGSFGGVMLSSGYYNVTLKGNNYSQTPYPVITANSGTSGNGTFTDPSKEVSNIVITPGYSSSSITNGKTTTYTIKVSNKGKGSANNVKIGIILPCAAYANYKVEAVSRGSFDSATGTWNIGSLNANSDAIIVFTVTAKHAGSCSNTLKASYTDNGGNKTLNAPKSTLTINKDVRPSYSYAISQTSVKKGGYFYVTVTLKNSGIDTSGTCTVEDRLSGAFSKISTGQTSPFKFSSGKWTGTIGSGKTITLKIKVKMVKKGKYTIPILINGKTTKNYVITGY